MVTVPNVAPDTPTLRRNPTFMYFQDGFQKPAPFREGKVGDAGSPCQKIEGYEAGNAYGLAVIPASG